MTTKQCSACNEIKDITEFYKDKSMKDGHLNKCKGCKKSCTRKNTVDRIALRTLDDTTSYDESTGIEPAYQPNSFLEALIAHKKEREARS
jgi:hypothetical protein